MQVAWQRDVRRFRWTFASFPAVLIMLPVLLFPQNDETRMINTTELYRQMYRSAMADSVITPDEERLLMVLKGALSGEQELVEAALGEPALLPPPGPSQAGRWTMMAQNMVWGSTLYGWGIPFVLGVNEDEDFKYYLASEMFSFGGALYLTWKYTDGRHFPEARSQMQRHGELVGMHYGFALNSLLEPGDREQILMVMATVPLGAWAGDRLYRRWQPSTGQSYALALYSELGRSLMSNLYHQLSSRPVEPDEEDYGYDPENGVWVNGSDEYDRDYSKYEEDYRPWSKGHLSLTALGYPIGALLGRHYYGQRQYSFGDAALLVVSRATGAMYGLGFGTLLGLAMEDDDVAWRYVVTGTSLGCVVAADRYFLKGYDYTFGQTAILSLGGVAGAAFGVGLVVLMETTERKLNTSLIIGSSMAGFGLTRRIVIPAPENSLGAVDSQTGISLGLVPRYNGNRIVPAFNLSVNW
ncbi:MAG: hypothetical protein KAU50_11860 [Candidatus Marinimicrobia bacterium]|nr:hypothetical protein [Candidatus Neomarinimicrobiota bacterium]